MSSKITEIILINKNPDIERFIKQINGYDLDFYVK